MPTNNSAGYMQNAQNNAAWVQHCWIPVERCNNMITRGYLFRKKFRQSSKNEYSLMRFVIMDNALLDYYL